MKVLATIEIPKGCKVKYEHDKDTNSLKVDRILKLQYPFNYGYIPNTLWYDGDPLDVIIVGDFELQPLSQIEVTAVAVVKMLDNGVSDYKVVCTFNSDKFNEYKDVIEGFLKVYKKGVEIEGYETSKKFIKETIQKSYNLYG